MHLKSPQEKKKKKKKPQHNPWHGVRTRDVSYLIYIYIFHTLLYIIDYIYSIIYTGQF